MLEVDGIDHLVLTVADIDRTRTFYERVLGMRHVVFGPAEAPRHAIAFGTQKINLHPAHAIPDPNVLKPTPGSADFCLITRVPLAEVEAHLAAEGVAVILGPVNRTGARGPMRSLYFRDPDLNLIEIGNYGECVG